jgi:inosine-uridine nucleoside N-ribohydrolase
MTPVVLVDTDVGLGTPRAEIDDGAALILLCRALKEQVLGVTTVHGNVQVDLATQNTLRLLHQLDASYIPVGRGAADPLIEDKTWFAEWEAGYGLTPPWPVDSPLPLAANLIIDTVRAHPGQVTLLAVGPLTNLALAIRLAPDIVGQVREVISMGGRFGENDPEPEFNARCDPEAAAIVINAGWPIRLIGLDITNQVIFTRADFLNLNQTDAASRSLQSQAPTWIERVEAQGWGHGGCALHDAVAAVALLEPEILTFRGASIAVELQDPARRGATYVQESENPAAHVQVAVDVDAARCKGLIWRYLSSPPEG